MICKKCHRPTRSPYVYGACACLTPDQREQAGGEAKPCTCLALPGNDCPQHGPVRPVGEAGPNTIRCWRCGDTRERGDPCPSCEIRAISQVEVGPATDSTYPAPPTFRERIDAIVDKARADGRLSPPTYRAARVRFPEGVTPGDAEQAVREFLTGMGWPIQEYRYRDWPNEEPAVMVGGRLCSCDAHAVVLIEGTCSDATWLPVMKVHRAWDAPAHAWDAFRALVPPRRPRSHEAGNPAGWDGARGRMP